MRPNRLLGIAVLTVSWLGIPLGGMLPSAAAGTSSALPVLDDEHVAIEARRAEVLRTARRYLNHPWRASEANILHGADPDGVRVDTPDRVAYPEGGKIPSGGYLMDGSENHGLPYQWGGFSTPEQFDAALERGLAAGHLPTGRGASASRHAAGVDCSGFVSRCWGLAAKRSTRSLAELCLKLEDPSTLRPGDALNRSDGHVVLLLESPRGERGTVEIVEAGFPGVQTRVVDVQSMLDEGYEALRYGPLDESFAISSVDFGEEPSPIAESDGATPTWLELGADPLGDAAPGSWVEYSLDAASDSPSRRLRVGLVAADDEQVRLHLALYTPEGLTEELRTVTRAAMRDAWTMLAFEMQGMVVLTEPEVEAGDERALESSDSSRIRRSGEWCFDGRRFPCELCGDVRASDAIPLLGLARAEIEVELKVGESTSRWTATAKATAIHHVRETVKAGADDRRDLSDRPQRNSICATLDA